MSKQDRQGARTPADIERKYALGNIDKRFAQFMGMIDDTRNEVDRTESELRSEITTSVTSLKRDTEQIVLSAKKEIEGQVESLSETLENDYYTIEQTEATLKVTADEISSNVAATYATKIALNSTDEKVAAAQSAAASAQSKADEADAKAIKAEADLVAAQQNLETVTSRVGATEEEIAEAQAAVTEAQEAVTAAQAAADKAQADADKALADVGALTVRVTKAETDISQTAEEIALRATKTEMEAAVGDIQHDIEDLSDTLESNYYTKTQSDAAITVKADEITQQVSVTYATKTALSDTDSKASLAQAAIDGLEIGGRNLLLDSLERVLDAKDTGTSSDNYNYVRLYFDVEVGETYTVSANVEITSGAFTGMTVYPYPGGATSTATITDGRIEKTFTVTSDTVDSVLIYAGLSGSTRGNGCKFTHIKIEKGNRATDWTPAPEDIAAETNEIRERLVDAIARIELTEDGILQVAEKNYIKTEDLDTHFATFKESVKSEIEQLAESVAIRLFKTRLDNAEAKLNGINEDLEKHFDFTLENGLIIRAAPNAKNLTLDNDEAYFSQGNEKESTWDSESFSADNIYIGKLGQFGNYAFEAFEDDEADGLDFVGL